MFLLAYNQLKREFKTRIYEKVPNFVERSIYSRLDIRTEALNCAFITCSLDKILWKVLGCVVENPHEYFISPLLCLYGPWQKSIRFYTQDAYLNILFSKYFGEPRLLHLLLLYLCHRWIYYKSFTCIPSFETQKHPTKLKINVEPSLMKFSWHRGRFCSSCVL